MLSVAPAPDPAPATPGPRVRRRTPERPRLRDHRALVAVCTGLVVAETMVIELLRHGQSVALAPQVTAPEPFGIMHDLRWFAVFHRSWAGGALEILALVAFRSLLVVLLTRLAWEPDRARPGLFESARHGTGYVVGLVVVSYLWIAVLFGLAVVSVEWLFFVGVPSLLLIALVTHHGVVRSWWSDSPRLVPLLLIAASFVELSAAGALMTATSTVALRMVIAVAAGGANAWLWMAIVDRITRPATQPRFRPVAPVAIAALVIVTLVGVAIGAGELRRTGTAAATRAARAVGTGTGPAVLVATGFDTHWTGAPDPVLRPGSVQTRFSYRGTDATGRPLPYDAPSTHRSVRALVATMRTQVDELHRRTRRPVALVAESEGALVTAAYVVAHPHAPVSNVVILSPLLAPARVSYPPADTQGWGLVSGWALRGISNVVGSVSPLHLAADAPLLRSIAGHPRALRSALDCLPARVDRLAIVPLTAGLGGASPDELAMPSTVVAAVHGGLLGNPGARAVIARALAGHAPGAGPWRDVAQAIYLASAAWQVPPLPAPRADGTPGVRCSATAAAARHWLGRT